MPKRSALRRTARYPIVLPVSYQPENPDASSTRAGRTCSLSTAGACLELSERLLSGVRISLIIQTDQECLSTTASVVWVEPLGQTAKAVRHGVAFTHLTSVQQEVLRGAIRRHARAWAPARVQLSLPARCLATEAAAPVLAGWTADLGRGGLALDLPEPLPIGTPVAVTLAAPRGEVTATATIVWVEPFGTSKCLRHGLLLTNPGSMWDLRSDFQTGELPSKESVGAETPAVAA